MTFRLKRRAMPKSWPIGRKGSKWILRTAPGPHSLEESLPVALVLRDLLKTANSSREVRKLLREGKVFIDGKVVKDPSRGLGLMDVLSLGAPPSQHYRMLKSRLGKLEIRSIPADHERVFLDGGESFLEVDLVGLTGGDDLDPVDVPDLPDVAPSGDVGEDSGAEGHAGHDLVGG